MLSDNKKGGRFMKAQFVYYFLTLAGLVLLPLSVTGQKYAGRRVWVLKNEKMEVMIAPGGGHIASATLTSGRGRDSTHFGNPSGKVLSLRSGNLLSKTTGTLRKPGSWPQSSDITFVWISSVPSAPQKLPQASLCTERRPYKPGKRPQLPEAV